jgi:microcystin degradation protein MlrC
VPLTAKVLNLSDGRFDLEDPHSHLASMTGLHVRMGDCATIQAANLTILLTSSKVPPFDLGQLRSQGIEPTDALVIGAKAAVGHRQAYRPIAAREASVDTPGLGTSNLPTLPYRRLARPIFPLDTL